MKRSGFSVVELIIVIVVIAILASITIAGYSFMQDDASDTKIRAAVKSAGDALVLYESQNSGARPAATGTFGVPNGLDSVLVPKYLKDGYRSGLSSRNTSDPNNIFRWYGCSDGGFVIYASLSSPTAEEVAQFGRNRTYCGHTTTQAPEAGNSRYNYSQLF